MVNRVEITEKASEVVERLKRPARPADVPPIGGLLRWLGADVLSGRRLQGRSAGCAFWASIAGCEFYIGAAQFEYWRHTQLIIDVVPGRGSGFLARSPGRRPLPDPQPGLHRRGSRRTRSRRTSSPRCLIGSAPAFAALRRRIRLNSRCIDMDIGLLIDGEEPSRQRRRSFRAAEPGFGAGRNARSGCDRCGRRSSSRGRCRSVSSLGRAGPERPTGHPDEMWDALGADGRFHQTRLGRDRRDRAVDRIDVSLAASMLREAAAMTTQITGEVSPPTNLARWRWRCGSRSASCSASRPGMRR